MKRRDATGRTEEEGEEAMKEIKFRLIKDRKIVGHELHRTSSLFDDHHIEIFHSTNLQEWWNICSTPWHFIAHDEKNSFTGLLDKNGKEIWEGDIVVKNGYIWFDDGKPNYRGTVEWIYSGWQVVAHCVNSKKRGISDGINEELNEDGIEDGENSDWEVIGNIHENPSLLEAHP